MPRHTYDAVRKEWRKKVVQVKIENEKFAEGCMRAAFKAKVTELSDKDWKSPRNTVLKEYLDPGNFQNKISKKSKFYFMTFFETSKVKNDVYFTDVVTQAEAKMYAEQYNKYAKRKVGLKLLIK